MSADGANSAATLTRSRLPDAAPQEHLIAGAKEWKDTGTPPDATKPGGARLRHGCKYSTNERAAHYLRGIRLLPICWQARVVMAMDAPFGGASGKDNSRHGWVGQPRRLKKISENQEHVFMKTTCQKGSIFRLKLHTDNSIGYVGTVYCRLFRSTYSVLSDARLRRFMDMLGVEVDFSRHR